MGFFIKFYSIAKKFKLETFKLLILSFLAVSFEIIGIGAILPAVSLLSGQEINIYGINVAQYLKNIEFINNLSLEGIVFFLLFLIFFIKFIFFSFFIYYQAKLNAIISTKISSDLFSKYIHSDYEFYFTRNTSELMRNVLGEANNFNKRIYFPILQIIIDTLILIGIMIIIFLVDYKMSLFLLMIYGIFGCTYFISIKKRLYLLGEDQLKYDKNRIKSSQESFQSIKTIKIFFVEKKYIEMFNYYYSLVANIIKNRTILQKFPRYAVELLTIISFIFISLYLLGQNNKFIDIVPKLALYVTAAIRILPSVNNLIFNNQLIRTGLASLNNLSKEINRLTKKESEDNTSEIIDFNNKIKFENLDFAYNSEKKIFENLNFEIEKGDLIGLMGKTGSGKTTFVDIFLGLLMPKKGFFKVDGKKIDPHSKAWKNILGYVPQEIHLFDESIKNNIVLNKNNPVDEDSYNKSIKMSEVSEFIDEKKTDKLLTGERGIILSGGQKQRIGIARALYKNPEIIILDEATNSLDKSTERLILDSIYKLKKIKTIIIISHDKSILDNCDKIYEISNKNIIRIK